MNYDEILQAISQLSLEDKEDLAEELTLMIQSQIDELPYQPDHFDEHRASEMRTIAGNQI